jgi:hypothetical protein
MRWPSSALHQLSLRLLKRTAYYHDARRNFLKRQHAEMSAAEHDQAVVDAMQRIAD